jgi:hypothetical protein
MARGQQKIQSQQKAAEKQVIQKPDTEYPAGYPVGAEYRISCRILCS